MWGGHFPALARLVPSGNVALAVCSVYAGVYIHLYAH